jgi:hypothetical protein
MQASRTIEDHQVDAAGRFLHNNPTNPLPSSSKVAGSGAA